MDVDENPADESQPPQEGVPAVNPRRKSPRRRSPKAKKPRKKSPKAKPKKKSPKRKTASYGHKTKWYKDKDTPQFVRDDLNALTTYDARKKFVQNANSAYKRRGTLKDWDPQYKKPKAPAASQIGRKAWLNDPDTPQDVKDHHATLTGRDRSKYENMMMSRYRKWRKGTNVGKKRKSTLQGTWAEIASRPRRGKKSGSASAKVSRQASVEPINPIKQEPGIKQEPLPAQPQPQAQLPVVHFKEEFEPLQANPIAGHGASAGQALNLELADDLGIAEPDLGDEPLYDELPALDNPLEAIRLRAGEGPGTMMTFTPADQLGVRESPAALRSVTNPANILTGKRVRKQVNYRDASTIMTPRSEAPPTDTRVVRPDALSVHSEDPTILDSLPRSVQSVLGQGSEIPDEKMDEAPPTKEKPKEQTPPRLRFVDPEIASLLGQDDDFDDSSTLAGLSTGSRWAPQTEERKQREEDDINRITNAPIGTLPTRWTAPQNVGFGQETVTDVASLPQGMSVGIRNVRPDMRYRTDAPSPAVFAQNIPVVGGVVNKDVANFYYRSSFEPSFKKSWAATEMPWLFGVDGVYPMLYSECDCEDDIDGSCIC